MTHPLFSLFTRSWVSDRLWNTLLKFYLLHDLQCLFLSLETAFVKHNSLQSLAFDHVTGSSLADGSFISYQVDFVVQLFSQLFPRLKFNFEAFKPTWIRHLLSTQNKITKIINNCCMCWRKVCDICESSRAATSWHYFLKLTQHVGLQQNWPSGIDLQRQKIEHVISAKKSRARAQTFSAAGLTISPTDEPYRCLWVSSIAHKRKILLDFWKTSVV